MQSFSNTTVQFMDTCPAQESVSSCYFLCKPRISTATLQYLLRLGGGVYIKSCWKEGESVTIKSDGLRFHERSNQIIVFTNDKGRLVTIIHSKWGIRRLRMKYR